MTDIRINGLDAQILIDVSNEVRTVIEHEFRLSKAK